MLWLSSMNSGNIKSKQIDRSAKGEELSYESLFDAIFLKNDDKNALFNICAEKNNGNLSHKNFINLLIKLTIHTKEETVLSEIADIISVFPEGDKFFIDRALDNKKKNESQSEGRDFTKVRLCI